jgi:hypothetical protein
MIVGTKIIISSHRPVVDTNSKVLHPGVYTFIVDSLGDGEVIRGRISESPCMGEFFFKSFTLIKLMAKAQSFMHRRLNVRTPILAEVTHHPSPTNSPYNSGIKRLNNKPAFFNPAPARPTRKAPSPLRIVNREDTCAICLEKCNKKTAKCGHYFHRACINTWRRRSVRCPICRRRLAVHPKLINGSPINQRTGARIRSHSENTYLPSLYQR